MEGYIKHESINTKNANEQRMMQRKTDLFTAKKRRLGTILTLRVYFASKHFGDSACFCSKNLRDSVKYAFHTISLVRLWDV